MAMAITTGAVAFLPLLLVLKVKVIDECDTACVDGARVPACATAHEVTYRVVRDAGGHGCSCGHKWVGNSTNG
eukprot:6179175-Pleurochrysis_carterae.AAC.4